MLGLVAPENVVPSKLITTFDGAVHGNAIQSVGLFHSSGGS